MARAVGASPAQGASCGYRATREPRERDSIIGHRALMNLPGIPSIDALRRLRKPRVEEAHARADQAREGKWIESIAQGAGTLSRS